MSAFLVLLAVAVVLMFAISAFDLPARRRRYGEPLMVDRGPDLLEEDVYDYEVVSRPRPRRVVRRRRL
ncbi:MAG TPA: hypothetical protein VHE80_09370 [Acidimicrobiales bacterium]|nr:hypothetical protein [Acidimicrobiales bacterium]